MNTQVKPKYSRYDKSPEAIAARKAQGARSIATRRRNALLRKRQADINIARMLPVVPDPLICEAPDCIHCFITTQHVAAIANRAAA